MATTINPEEKNIFSSIILTRAARCNSETPHIETFTDYCEENELEPDIMAKHVNDVLLQKIEEEAQFLRYIPRESKLPI